MDFDINRILRILPHRSPFVLIDRVVELAPRQSARAIKCVTYNEPFFPGHFPGAPIFPGGLILEAYRRQQLRLLTKIKIKLEPPNKKHNTPVATNTDLANGHKQ